MSGRLRIAIITVLVIAIVGILIVKSRREPLTNEPEHPQIAETEPLPRLIEVGSVGCIPCKMMAPIMEELRDEYAGRLYVEFIDTEKDPDAAELYAIKVPPTQIFLDVEGQEIYRHEGFISKEDIIAKWQELGFLLDSSLTVSPEVISDTVSASVVMIDDDAAPDTVAAVYPGLTSGVLMHAHLTTLPEGILLRAEDFTVGANDIGSMLENVPEKYHQALRNNEFFILEQLAMSDIFERVAKAELVASGVDVSTLSRAELVDSYLTPRVNKVTVSDDEIRAFYEENEYMFGGASLTVVSDAIQKLLLGERKQAAVLQEIKNLGKKISIEISAEWVKVASVHSFDNDLDRARMSGKPSMVDFGRDGCGPCEMMEPILETLKEKYEGKVNVIFVHVGEHPILSERYNVDGIPVQVFFNKAGQEVWRHTGFLPQEIIEKKLAELGVD